MQPSEPIGVDSDLLRIHVEGSIFQKAITYILQHINILLRHGVTTAV